MNRRVFIFGLLVTPLMVCAETMSIPVLARDLPRFKDEDALRELLWKDLQDMNVHQQIGPNLARVKEEDKLYAQIQSDRKW